MLAIVIGSGIVGASTAYHLSMAGVEVIVADEARPGRATDAGAGIVCPWATSLDDGPFYDLYADGAAYYGALVPGLTELGRTGIGHRRVGALVLSDDDDELATIERRVNMRAIGRPEVGAVARIAAEEAKTLFPPLRAGIEAVHIEGGARVDGRLLAAALIDGASSGVGGGTGLGAAGLTTGPLTGRMLADLVLGRPVGPDLSPFAPAGPR